MSLYYEAAALITNEAQAGGSLKSRIFNAATSVQGDAKPRSHHPKNAPAKLYALITEATKWSSVLSQIIDSSDLLRLERKLTPALALTLSHDLLLSKRGIQAPVNHPLTTAISKHKGRLAAELSRLRIKRKHADIDSFRREIEAFATGELEAADAAIVPTLASSNYRQPRWIRVNTLRTTVQDVVEHVFAGLQSAPDLASLTSASAGSLVYHRDQHIPNLFAIPRSIDIIKDPYYKDGRIVLQDKASCFPAYLLDPGILHGDIIDACAAPGNKTTHLAALVDGSDAHASLSERKIYAFERDSTRSKFLQSMVLKTDAQGVVTVLSSTDFLSVKPDDKRFGNVTALLLDPSCSGSGIVGRDDGPVLILPQSPFAAKSSGTDGSVSASAEGGSNRKRKRHPGIDGFAASTKAPYAAPATNTASAIEDSQKTLQSRLETLANFQLKLLKFAMSFPAAQRITYSTCSVHAIENEGVVVRAMLSEVAKSRGWRLLRREEQVDGMRKWHVRGDVVGTKEFLARVNHVEEMRSPDEKLEMASQTIADACIRCEKGTEEGTMGFFVAAFTREGLDADRSKPMDADFDVAKLSRSHGHQKVTGSLRESAQASGSVKYDKDRVSESEDEWEGFSASDND